MANHAILTPEAHRDLRVHGGRGAAYGDDMMLALVVPPEFRKLQSFYPILFRLDRERERFSAVALFGFEPGENLFLDEGGWDAGYLPLAVDVQPFLIGGRPGGFEAKQVHIDLAHPRLDWSGKGMRIFDEEGCGTPLLDRVARQLGELDAGYAEYDGFFDALSRYELLEPLTLKVRLDDGSTNRLVGFHAIDEERLQMLDGEALGDLHLNDWLLPIFMAVASIGNFSNLIARKNRKLRDG